MKSKKNDTGISTRDLKIIVQLLSAYPQVEEAFIFGSRAKGTHEKASDIDICLKGKDVDSSVVSKIHWALEEETVLPYFFDVLSYEGLSNLELKEHVDRVGHLFYSKRSR